MKAFIGFGVKLTLTYLPPADSSPVFFPNSDTEESLWVVLPTFMCNTFCRILHSVTWIALCILSNWRLLLVS